MTEQIGKVTLDYTFYNGQDQYSDGDIENDLLQLIMEEPDVEKILAEDDPVASVISFFTCQTKYIGVVSF